MQSQKAGYPSTLQLHDLNEALCKRLADGGGRLPQEPQLLHAFAQRVTARLGLGLPDHALSAVVASVWKDMVAESDTPGAAPASAAGKLAAGHAGTKADVTALAVRGAPWENER